MNPAELPEVVPGRAAVQGAVYDMITDERIVGARIILQCACLPGARETVTDARGVYSFVDLPPGTYSLQVLYQEADKSSSVVLSRIGRAIDRIGIYPKKRPVIIVG